MKYSEYRSKPKFKGSAAFYIVIACCLLSIGGAAWFAASSIKSREIPQDNSSIGSTPEISTPEITAPPVAEETTKPVENEPYSSEQTPSEPTKAESKPLAFTMPVQGDIIKNYDERALQYSATYGDMRMHTAVDIACEDGTAISSAAAGTVLSVEESATLGTVVTIDHGASITAKYAAVKDPKVKAGDKVAAGDIIGNATTIPSECADQSHLHIEVYKDSHPVSPISLFGLK